MTDSQRWLFLAFAVLLGWLLYLLSPILLPFVVSAVLAYLGDPLVDRLEAVRIANHRIGRTAAVTFVFFVLSLFVIALLLVVIPGVESQITLFLKQLPGYLRWVNEEFIPLLKNTWDIEVRPFDSSHLIDMLKENWRKAGGIATSVIGSVTRSGSALLEWMVNVLFIPVITFYLLRDWDVLVANVSDLIPRRYAPTADRIASESDQVLGAFLRGQFYVMISLGAIYSVGLWLVGLELALLIGMLAGLVSFVPYLGSIVGIVVACFAALLQFHDPVYLVPVAIVFMVGQSLEGMWLTPWLVGDQIGLHPVAVIFAVLAGGQLFGFLGILLALPFASVVMVLLRHFHSRYTGSGYYSEDFKP